MNYRHAYHAGNFADVLKHAVLALVIEHLKLKPAPFRVIDTHAGTGLYDLSGDQAQKTGEWRDGIARVLAAKPPPAVAETLRPYLNVVRGEDGAVPQFYPGSPMLARRMLRPVDRLIANELHPEDAAALAALFRRDRHVKVSTLDGWTALKAFLPPKERRGVVLIDPPFEQAGEFERLAEGLREAARRFATGTVLLWYPIKTMDPVTAFERAVADTGLPKILGVRLMVKAPAEQETLSGTGLVVLNPPFTLSRKLETLLPFLAATLGRDKAAGWRLAWLTGDRIAANASRGNPAES